MTAVLKVAHGTTAWFEMVGALMCEAASAADLASDFNVSLVERYIDGAQFSDGLVQGLRLDIIAGKPSCRVGARPEESADITVAVTSEASRELNALYSADPNFLSALVNFQSAGQLQVTGEFSSLGSWFDAVHDLIVDRTM